MCRMASLLLNVEKSYRLVAVVEVTSHPLVIRKVEKILLRWLNYCHPRSAPAYSSWMVFAINEMIFWGTLELLEVNLALKYDIGLGAGGLPLDVHRRLMDEVLVLDTDELSDSSCVEFVSMCEDGVIDLTLSTDENGHGTTTVQRKSKRKRKRKNVKKKQKRLKLENTRFYTDEPELWTNFMEVDDNENLYTDSLPQYNPIMQIAHPFSHINNTDWTEELRVGILCPRPYQTQLLNTIMNVMDNIDPWEPHPQFKRNGCFLDTMWFLGANGFSSSWLISTVEQLSKTKHWRAACLLAEPWGSQYEVKNIIQVTLPWKRYKGNEKAKVIQRLRKANTMHGSYRWNLIGSELDNFQIQVTLAVNDETMESLRKTHFNVFYGFNQYRCHVIKTLMI